MAKMKFGAYYSNRDEDIVWFRTALAMETGFYHRHTRSEEPPDVCIAESVPELIMKVYPWIHKEEVSFQNKVGHPGRNAEEQSRMSEKMTDQLVQRLDPDDDTVWVNEPHWVKHLHTTS
jgi:hypothetical protein